MIQVFLLAQHSNHVTTRIFDQVNMKLTEVSARYKIGFETVQQLHPRLSI